jgi:hypothetical protein
MSGMEVPARAPPAPPGTAAEKQEEAKAAEHDVATDARKEGAYAFEFDPNASSAEKSAQVKKVRLTWWITRFLQK